MNRTLSSRCNDQTLLNYIRNNHNCYHYRAPNPFTETRSYLDLVRSSPRTGAGESLGIYKLGSVLGYGSYGKVRIATNQQTLEQVAIKFVSKTIVKKPNHLARIKREVRLHRLFVHPHIIKLHSVLETSEDVVLVMEHAEGGELSGRVQCHGILTEHDSRHVFNQLLSCVHYLHNNGIIHRDLKPQNILLSSKSSLDIKLIDFGFATIFDPEEHCSTFCGSPFYSAPEMILGEHYVGPEVDIWSLGIILYFMVVGHVPFHDENTKGLYSKILKGQYTVPSHVSDSLADLFEKMLTVERQNRITLDQIVSHPWVGRAWELPLPIPLCSDPHPWIVSRLGDFGIDPGHAIWEILNRPWGKAAKLYRLLEPFLFRRHLDLPNMAKTLPKPAGRILEYYETDSLYGSPGNVHRPKIGNAFRL